MTLLNSYLYAVNLDWTGQRAGQLTAEGLPPPFRLKGFARLEKVRGEGYRFTEITLAPEIGVAAEDMEKAQKVPAKAEQNCFISKSLRATVQVEPRFVAVSAELAH